MSARLTAAEQLIVELTNRARLDPAGEARRYGIDLDDGYEDGHFGTQSRQVLAPNMALNRSAVGHSAWMLETDTFGHSGAGGSNVTDRVQSAGFVLRTPWHLGENISQRGTTGTLDLAAEALDHHRGLFQSASHRETILEDDFRQVGIGQVAGRFTAGGTTYNTSMLTEDFARSGNAVFLTGVSYVDRDGDQFYSVGEGRGGLRIDSGGRDTESWSAGGYALRLADTDWADVRLAWGNHNAKVAVDASMGNVKLDLVGNGTVLSSASLDIGWGVRDAQLLGVMDRNLTGSKADNRLIGNAGDNRIEGGAGSDLLRGKAGDDHLLGGKGGDRLVGGNGDDRLAGGSGRDLLDGGRGRDRLDGGDGADRLRGGSQSDRLKGGGGDDDLGGGGGNDRLFGGAGNDRLAGDNGHDRLNGGAGADWLGGGRGNDLLAGDRGADRLYGGPGNDRLNGGAGNDRLTGGAGADSFVFRGDFGRDRIADFDQNDSVVLDGGEAQSFAAFRAASHVENGNLVYDLHDDGLNVIVFKDTTLADLSPDHFVFG